MPKNQKPKVVSADLPRRNAKRRQFKAPIFGRCYCDRCGEESATAKFDSQHFGCSGLSSVMLAKVKANHVNLSCPEKKGTWRKLPDTAVAMAA